MNTHKFIAFIAFLVSCFSLSAQVAPLKGWVVADENGEPLVGATVYWEKTTNGTTTDTDGRFEIPRIDEKTRHLVIKYIGYQPIIAPIEVTENNIRLRVSGVAELEQIVVTTNKKAYEVSLLSTLSTDILGEGELRKAPCCNLSESFETNPTVDVHFTDAVTGAKEIEMLGLRGVYSQLMIGNRPALYGIANPFALEYLPGTWMESIQISKGASSVINGPKSITGSINAELHKPEKGDKLFVNGFFTAFGRAELNVHSFHKVAKGLHTGVMVHGNWFQTEVDHNHDGFLDIPQKKQFNGIWRSSYSSKAFESQLDVQYLKEERNGGQTMHGHDSGEHVIHGVPIYLAQLNSERAEATWKLGYIGFKKPYQNLGFQSVATYQNQSGIFGDNIYKGRQQSAYLNAIFETIIVSTDHKLRTGASYAYDRYEENFGSVTNGFNGYDRTEHLPGVFGEYNFCQKCKQGNKFDKIGVIVGMRADYLTLNNYGLILSPRVNFKYNLTEKLVVRLSSGRGFRTANYYAENLGLMPGSRRWEVQGTINPEIAWNNGVNLTWKYEMGEARKEGSVSLDFFRTDFTNQVVVDLFANTDRVIIQNLAGRSYANSFIAVWQQELFKGFELKLGYKFNDVWQTFSGDFERKPLLPQHSGLVHIFYETGTWQFSATSQFTGPQRLARTYTQAEATQFGLPDYRVTGETPIMTMLQAQVTKKFPKLNIEIYAGAENLLNTRQANPIVNWQDPTNYDNQPSVRFDATQVYGPIMGIMPYIGFRYKMAPAKGHEHEHEDISVNILTSAQCGMCKEFIEGALNNLKGVHIAVLDLETKIVKVSYHEDEVSPEAIRAAINAVGYDADGTKADPNVYQNLPACCKKPE